MGFPLANWRLFLFFSSLKTSICYYRVAPPRQPRAHRVYPFQLRPREPIGRAGNEGDTWIRDYIAAMKSNLSIHGTMDPFDTATAISHFLRMKSFPRAGPFIKKKKNVPPLYLLHLICRWELIGIFCRVNIWKSLKFLVHYKSIILIDCTRYKNYLIHIFLLKKL